MKIKDIVNRDIVNLTNCDQEPIHIPGSIQPHGVLLAFNADTFIIDYCSENTEEFLHIKPAEVLSKSIEAIFGDAAAQLITTYINNNSASSAAPLHIEFNGTTFYCVIHKSNNYWIAEFEPVVSTLPGASIIYDQTVQFVQYMQQTHSLQQLCAKIAEEVKSLTGYDRVMIYRFDKDYNGEVYAESKREDLESFFGLHYPHTDIPVQARQLYIRNLLRLIVDINYEPVPLLTVDDAPNKNLDLSLSTLRSVSPIHVQYLQNMGVGATLTISLLHEGKLWGLITCHHYSKKYIDHYVRINAQLQGHFLTSQINVRQIAEEHAVSGNVNIALESLLNQVFVPERSSLEQIIQQPQLLAVCNAAGVCILLDDVIYKNGVTPNNDSIKNIATWALNKYTSIFSTSKLVDEYAEAKDCTEASGIIFCSLGGLNKACIIWFNPETLEEVNWAGEPEKAIIKDENGLHPRKSFETWKQVTKCQSREWAKPEITAASNFAYALQKHITLLLLTEEEKRQRQLTDELKETNAELENINWLSTHDLKEPLRKIQLFSSKLMSSEKDLSPATNTTLKKMSDSAYRMQMLIQDLTNYSRLRKSRESFETIDLNEMLTIITNELSEDIQEKKAVIHSLNNLPEVMGVPVLVKELFINLIRNALKFARLNVQPEIKILYAKSDAAENNAETKSYHKISVADNGIGFNNEYSADIFKIFTRLHNAKQSEGSGVGLALCKKIMQIHGGLIKASGKENEGAEFQLYFPVEFN